MPAINCSPEASSRIPNSILPTMKSRLFRWLLALALICLIVTGITVQGQNDPTLTTDKVIIEQAVAKATTDIQKLAKNNPDAFSAVLQQSFGKRLNNNVRQELVKQAAQGQLPLPERILFVPSEVLDSVGASAAYGTENGGVILINARLRSDSASLRNMILHEWGHHLDAKLGAGDAAGEEGELFLLGNKNGGAISVDQQRRLDAFESGHAKIQFEGRTISVELGCGFPYIHCAATALGNIVTSVGKGLVTLGEKAVSLVGNAGKAIGNTLKAGALGVAGGIAKLTGDDALADQLLGQAGDSIRNAGGNLKDAANNIVDSLAAPGDVYNQTAATLNDLVPGLGTIGQLAASFTPAGPYLAAAKGVADIKSAYEHGGIGAALLATSFAALDVGGAAIGRLTKGVKAARGGAKGVAVFKAKKAAEAAKAAAKKAADAAAKAAKTGTKKAAKAAEKAAKAAKKKADEASKLAYAANAPNMNRLNQNVLKRTYKDVGQIKDTNKLFKATNAEKALGARIIKNPNALKALNAADKVRKTRPKSFIAGRDRNDEGELLGTGESKFSGRVNNAKDKINSIIGTNDTPTKPLSIAPVSVKLSIQQDGDKTHKQSNGYLLALHNGSDAYQIFEFREKANIILDVTFVDGTTLKSPHYQKAFARNVIFDAESGDPKDLIEVVYWNVDSKDPQRGTWAVNLKSTQKGIGRARLKVSFRNAPGVTASINVDVIDGSKMLWAKKNLEKIEARDNKAQADDIRQLSDNKIADEKKVTDVHHAKLNALYTALGKAKMGTAYQLELEEMYATAQKNTAKLTADIKAHRDLWVPVHEALVEEMIHTPSDSPQEKLQQRRSAWKKYATAEKNSAKLAAKLVAHRAADERDITTLAAREAAEQQREEAEYAARIAAQQQAEYDAQVAAQRQAEYDAQVAAQRQAEYDAQVAAQRQAEYDAQVAAQRQAEYNAQVAAQRQAEYDAQVAAQRQAEYNAQVAAQRQAEYDAQVAAQRQAEYDAQIAAQRQAEYGAQQQPSVLLATGNGEFGGQQASVQLFGSNAGISVMRIIVNGAGTDYHMNSGRCQGSAEGSYLSGTCDSVAYGFTINER